MIYTCTLNPSVDYFITVENFKKGQENQNKTENYTSGGKGINVSYVLSNLNVVSTAIGIIGGFTGGYIRDDLENNNCIIPRWFEVEGKTRLNVNLLSNERTIIKSRGPIVNEASYTQLIHYIEENVHKDDLFILSGSIPEGVKKDSYEQIASIVTKQDTKLVVDATGQLLLSTLSYKPFLIKPNKEELQDLFDVEITEEDDFIRYGKVLVERGAENVLISLGIDGAILITSNAVYRAYTVKNKAINPVGAGDSMVAGFIYNYINSDCYESALKFATACGTATALTKEFATYKQIQAILPHIRVVKVNQ